MKRKIKFLFILFVPCLCAGQKMDLIFGLRWDMTKSEVINTIKHVRGIEPSKNSGTTFISSLQYKDQYFDGHYSPFTIIYFEQNRLVYIEIFLTTPHKDELSNLFDSIKNTLTQKYFEPQDCEVKPTVCAWFFPKNDPSAKNGLLNLQMDSTSVEVFYFRRKEKPISDF